MKFSLSLQLILCCSVLRPEVLAFAPAWTPRPALGTVRSPASSTTARAFGVESWADQFAALQQAFTALSDADVLASAAASAEGSAEATAAAVAAKDNGWFGFLTGPIAFLLQLIHSVLVAVGVSADAWGVSIIAMTIFIKVVTYPLTKTQLESTNKMQAMQPAIKELQAKYQSNPEVMNQKIAEFYQTNNINPLAGCLPSLVQIPIFIGLYRAVLDLAGANKLDEPFLWLPNLEGPTYGADPASGSDWLFKGWVDGAPALGWHDTIAFLILPVLLIISQYVSMELMSPKTNDPAQQQSNAILKVLPIMIGWFSLNVPAALCVYWFANNIITTAMSVMIRNGMKTEMVTPGVVGSAAAVAPQPIFTQPREKPAGFGSIDPSASSTKSASSTTGSGIKEITSTPVDAEIVAETRRTTTSGEISAIKDAAETVGDKAIEDAAKEKRTRGKKRKKQN